MRYLSHLDSINNNIGMTGIYYPLARVSRTLPSPFVRSQMHSIPLAGRPEMSIRMLDSICQEWDSLPPFSSTLSLSQGLSSLLDEVCASVSQQNVARGKERWTDDGQLSVLCS